MSTTSARPSKWKMPGIAPGSFGPAPAPISRLNLPAIPVPPGPPPYWMTRRPIARPVRDRASMPTSATKKNVVVVELMLSRKPPDMCAQSTEPWTTWPLLSVLGL